jgi:transcription initiation factor TFIIE subunit alpha
MKITNTKIFDTVKEVVGEDSLKVVEFLKDKKNISDFKIAEKVNIDIHQIRNILYRLFNHNLVTYYRKKDRQKGWYISYWTFNKKRIKDLMKNLHYSKIEKFTERLQHEEANKGNFYLCPNACVRVNFDKATDLEFKCPECGTLLNNQDNQKTIDFLQTKIKELHMTNGYSKMDSLKIVNGISNSHSVILNGNNGYTNGNGHSKGHSLNGNGHKVNSITQSNKIVKRAKSSKKKH